MPLTMAEVVGSSVASDEEVVWPHAIAPRRSGSSILLLLMLAAVMWGVSAVLLRPGPVFRADTLENWLAFGQLILRDILRAVALLVVAVAVSVVVPQIGRAVERVILRSRRGVFLTVAAGLAVLTSGLFTYFVCGHAPRIQDETAMVFQAKLLATGRLFARTPGLIDFFDWEFIVVDGPRWYGKYFLGSSLVFVPGVWLGAVWLVNPVLAGLAVCLVYALGRELFNDKIARVAAVLMVISPFRISLFALMMGHPVCLLAVGLFALAVIKVVRDPTRTRWSLTAGASLGYAANCRPLTALTMGSVIGLMALFAMPWKRLRWPTVVAFAVPLLLFALVFLGYNQSLTGDPFKTPFRQWSAKDRIGLGRDVGLEYWPAADRGNSLRKALFKNSYFNLDALGLYLTGWGFVTLLLLVVPIFRSPWPRRSWALAAAVGGLVIVHLFYLTPSVLLGQARYWSESMPMMLLLVAVALVGVRRRLPGVCRWLGLIPAARTGRTACWLAGLMLTLWSIPRAYWPLITESNLDFWGPTSLLRTGDLAAEAGLENAVVFVTANLYRTHMRHRVWDNYGHVFSFNDPNLKGPVIYARDLGERNRELMAQYPGRRAYRLTRARYSTELAFVPMDLATAEAP